jgi:DNA-binding SARP family transcriptional activator/tetratricopeptide (TPR) repeat protein
MADDPAAAGGLTIGLLGPVDAYVSGTAASISQPALRVLLAMLALSANRVVPVSALIHALWQEDASRQREKNLHVQVHLLRRRLAELEPGRSTSRIVTAPPGYLIALDQGELDAQSFVALARQGRLLAGAGDPAAASELFGQALRLWRGPALGDVAYASPRLEAEAAGLEEQRVAVLEDQADADLAAGRHVDVAGHLPGLIAQHPLRERMRGQLMVALYRCGRQGDALAVYRQTRRALGEELGLDPGPQLQALHQQILAGDLTLDLSPASTEADQAQRIVAGGPGGPAGPGVTEGGRDGNQAASAEAGGSSARADGARQTAGPAEDAQAEPVASPVVPRQLPAGVRHFAGRDTEVQELDSLLDETVEIVTATLAVITGTAGAGKTALALHWAHRAASHFPDGQLYVNLRGYDPSGAPVRPAEAIRRLLHGLGVPREQIPDTQEAQAALYRSILADRRMLIVLDNAHDADQVRPLLPGGAGCLALVTSRSAMSGLVAAENAYLVPLGLLTHRDAVALLAVRLGPDRTAAEPAAVGQIIGLCTGLPLALAIAAARAAAQPALPLTALADDLAAEPDLLDALETGDQMTSLRAVFSWSYRQLPDPAARMFRLLAVHPGPDFSIAAAASLGAAGRPQARRILAELAAASLLTEHGPGRYVLHDLLRVYAAEQSADVGGESERVTAQARIIDHYLYTAYAATLLLAPLGHPIVLDDPQQGVTPEQLASREEALGWFRAEFKVLLATANLAATAGCDLQAWQLPWTLRSFLDGQGLWHDWDAVNQIALAAAERLQDHTGLGWTHHRMAQVCSLSGAVEDGIAHNLQALAHFGLAGNTAGQGSARLGLCISLGRQGNHQAALDHGEQALALFREAGDRIGQAYMLHLVGLELAQLGSVDQGREHCMQAVELYGELGDLGGLADAWHSLGTLHKQAGEHADAIACFQQSLMLSAELDDRWGQAYCLIYVGDTHDDAGDVLAARETWQQAIEMLGTSPHPDADRIRARLRDTADFAGGTGSAGRTAGQVIPA